ncbi:hypothetical protein ACN47E_004744 [Coniothyrium glycines]
MRFSTAVALVFSATAGFAAAQEKCAAQTILDTCVAGYQTRIDDCNEKGNDYICLCNVYKDVLVCYNNCPDSNARPPVQNQVTQFCQAAEPLQSAASASQASIASVAATQSRAATTTATPTGGSATGSGTTAPSAGAFATGAASANGVKAGAAIVAMLGAAGFL